MFTALEFLLRTLNFDESRVFSIPTEIAASGKTYEANVFEKKKLKNSRGTVVVVNGFSVYGHRDERTLKIAKIIASLGFRAIAPAFPDLNNLHIHPRTIGDMKAVIRAIAADEKLSGKKQIGVFAPSYSAGMMLNAIADENVGKHVSGICAVGSYGSIEQSLNFVINNNGIDDYGRNVLLYNFLPFTPFFTEGLLQIVKTAIEDNGFKRQKPMLPDALAKATKDDIEFWNRYELDIQFRKKILENAFQSVPNRHAWVEAFDLLPKISRVESEVIFIHGKNDLVIPATESILLHHELQRHGKKSFLCVTTVLDHGDVQKKISVFAEVFMLLKAFSLFFKRLEG